jgi:ABC-type nickel/cobalt efflux system permease component RcnA
MVQATMREDARDRRGGGGKIFGFPIEGFSLFQSLLLSLASAFLAFFAATCVAIFALLAWNLFGGHSVNYADTYRYVGLPAGLLVLAVALPFFLVLWVRAKARR